MSAVEPEHNAWIRRFHQAPEARTRVLCLPHAGGSASSFYSLSAALSPAVEVCAVQYPGRGERINEDPVNSLEALADHVVDALAPLPGRRLVLFGHSMGAAVAFEVARRLEARGDTPAALFVSSRRAPSRPRAERFHLLSDIELLKEVRRLNGTDSGVLADDSVLSLFLPAIRSDFTASETYSCRPDSALTCPVSAFFGDQDRDLTYDDLEAWQDHTTGDFDLTVFPGGHFYLGDQVAAVAQAVLTRIQPDGR
ncbi:thioesterase [Streptomyces sp. V2]|uniref:thioesterase II family protein n=1 Tax=Streptomyces TaxID=1883 RepID=UPI0006EB8B94|nr:MULTISPECIES: alpha/beta fold hydrolase [Streptomyces]PWG14306.1 thioesterase [Streptomyces sp. V2]